MQFERNAGHHGEQHREGHAADGQGNQLESVDLRFSPHCDGSATPLRGRIRWRSGASAV